MAREVLYEPFPQYEDYGDVMEGFAAEDAALRDLIAVSDNLPPGEVVGAVLSWQRGDGYAYYVVTSEHPLTLAWVPVGDRWQVEEALIRGMRRSDVVDMIDRDRKFRSLFGQSREAKRGVE